MSRWSTSIRRFQTSIAATSAKGVPAWKVSPACFSTSFVSTTPSIGLRNVHFRFGDGTLGWPEMAPFDRILITAGAPEVPKSLLLGQLKDGGFAVLPVGAMDEQMLVEVRREGNQLKTTDLGCPCRFVKLIGREGWGKD